MRRHVFIFFFAMLSIFSLCSLVFADVQDNVRVNTGTTSGQINVGSYCRKITNAAGTNAYIPIDTSASWNDLVANSKLPAGLSFSACCTSHASSACSGGNRYWYNSCAVQEDIRENCACGCSGDTCTGYTTWYYDGDGDGYYPSSPAAQAACSSPGAGWTSTAPPAATDYWQDYCVWLYGGDSSCNGGGPGAGGSYSCGTAHFGAYYGGWEPFHMSLVYSKDFWAIYMNNPASCFAPNGGIGQYFVANTYGGLNSNADDCNDGNAAIHMGATEVCNGADDDCDGQTDEGGVCCTSHASSACVPGPGGTIEWYDSCGNHEGTRDGCPGGLWACEDSMHVRRTSGGCSGGPTGCLTDTPIYCPYGCVGSDPTAHCADPPPAVCGNSVVETGETCDGNSQACGSGGTQSCNGACNGWNSCIEPPGCYTGEGYYFTHGQGDYFYEDDYWYGTGNCNTYTWMTCNSGSWDGHYYGSGVYYNCGYYN